MIFSVSRMDGIRADMCETSRDGINQGRNDYRIQITELIFVEKFDEMDCKCNLNRLPILHYSHVSFNVKYFCQ